MKIDKKKQRRKIRRVVRLLENRCCGFCKFYSNVTEDNIKFKCIRSERNFEYWSNSYEVSKKLSKKLVKIEYKRYEECCFYFQTKQKEELI